MQEWARERERVHAPWSQADWGLANHSLAGRAINYGKQQLHQEQQIVATELRVMQLQRVLRRWGAGRI